MGLFSFIRRRGTVSEVSHWAAKGCIRLLTQSPDMTAVAVFQSLIQERYPKMTEARERDILLNMAETVRGVRGLILAVLTVEQNSEYRDYVGRHRELQEAIQQILSLYDLPAGVDADVLDRASNAAILCHLQPETTLGELMGCVRDHSPALSSASSGHRPLSCELLVITDPATEQQEYHGLIRFGSASDRQDAIDRLQGQTLRGKPVSVRVYHERPESPIDEAASLPAEAEKRRPGLIIQRRTGEG